MDVTGKKHKHTASTQDYTIDGCVCETSGCRHMCGSKEQEVASARGSFSIIRRIICKGRFHTTLVVIYPIWLVALHLAISGLKATSGAEWD